MIFNTNKGEVLTIPEGGTGKKSAPEALEALGGMSEKTLWANASTSSAFGEQTIKCDHSTYDKVCVEFTNGHRIYLGGNHDGGTGMAEYTYTEFVIRQCKLVENGVYVYGSANRGNGYLKPAYVFGIKGVQ